MPAPKCPRGHPCPVDRWLVYEPGLAAWVDGNAMNVMMIDR